MATHETIGASYRGFHLMGLDGTVLDLPDTPENVRTFGRPRTGRAEGAFPQVRLLALCELGTHAICGLNIKPICHGEQSMVRPLLEQLRPGMLLIWDRGFFNFELIRSVCERGPTSWLELRATPYSGRSGVWPMDRTWPRFIQATLTVAETCAV